MVNPHRTAKHVKDVYRGYMPIGLPQHRPPNRIKPWWKVVGKPRVTLHPKPVIEGFSDEPEYPPLNDGSMKGLKKQVRLDWYESLKKKPTIEEKFHEMGNHQGHFLLHFNNWLPQYNSLPMINYLTQTNFINSLPDSYQSKGEEENSDLLKVVKRIVLDQVALEKYESLKTQKVGFVSKIVRDGNRTSFVSNRMIQNMLSTVKNCLAADVNTQLSSYHYDYSPAIRSWWYHSGFPAPNNKIFYKSRKDDEGLINQLVQMNGSSAMNIRSDTLLEPLMSLDDPLVTDTSLVQKLPHLLRNYGGKYNFGNLVALPGYWYHQETEFDCPHTCLLSTDCLSLRNKPDFSIPKPMDDDENCLNGQAVLTAFSWLNSLSMYHGYTPFNEIDYPFTCQLITTDGQNWMFNIYQLNCQSFHRDLGGPSKNNICWSSGLMQLFTDYSDGQFQGVNDDVVRLLIRFVSQKTSPEYTSQLCLRPHLGEDQRTDEEKDMMKTRLRSLIENKSNRWMLHQWKIPHWEHIFFRAKETRHKIRDMKPQWKPPKPKYPRIFE